MFIYLFIEISLVSSLKMIYNIHVRVLCLFVLVFQGILELHVLRLRLAPVFLSFFLNFLIKIKKKSIRVVFFSFVFLLSFR